MKLDINTPAGQKTLKDEQVIAEWLNTKNINYVQTPKNLPAKVDAILIKNNVIIAVAETKCRYNITLDSLRKNFNNTWLITEEKILEGLEVSKRLCVPLYGLLYLVPEDILIKVNLTETPRAVHSTWTQETVNGGLIERKNAYVNLHNAKIFTHIRRR